MITKTKNKEKLTMGMPRKIELSPWKTPLNYKMEESVKLPKISKIDKWE